MTIEKTEILDKEEKESKAQENEERDRIESERQAELEAAREEAKQSAIKAAKAEGEAEAFRRGLSQNQPAPQWNDEQWENEAQKHGMSGSQLKASVMVSKSVFDAAAKPLREEAEAARREAQEAREETRRIREGKSADKLKQDFYDKNAALRLHSKEVDEFLSTYPDADNVNGDALKKRLELAAKYVKGSVKENMRTSKPSESGSMRMEESEDTLPPGEIGDFDPKGTGNQGAASLMASVHSNFGSGIRRKDSIEVWKKSLDDEGRGVSISMDEDLERYNAMQERDIIGGKRG